MNYKNANNILPDRLVQEIQQYVQGEYIYIPIKDKVINEIPTEYRRELIKRNEHIYAKLISEEKICVKSGIFIEGNNFQFLRCSCKFLQLE